MVTNEKIFISKYDNHDKIFISVINKEKIIKNGALFDT
jgi:hypothetical protein